MKHLEGKDTESVTYFSIARMIQTRMDTLFGSEVHLVAMGTIAVAMIDTFSNPGEYRI